jgi:hypothetical protein
VAERHFGKNTSLLPAANRQQKALPLADASDVQGIENESTNLRVLVASHRGLFLPKRSEVLGKTNI